MSKKSESMTHRVRFGVLFAALLMCALSLSGQTRPPAAQTQDSQTQGPAPLPTPQGNVTAAAVAEAPAHTITIDVVAAHKSQPPVTGLVASEFTVLDNRKPLPVTSFKAFSGDETPVSVVLVIDAVNTSFSTVAQARGQIDKFLKSSEGRLAHPTSLAIFTDTGFLMEPGFSRDGNAMAASLDKQTIGLRDIRRSSGFYGAEDRTQLSLNALRQLAVALAKVPGRKLVLWVSPGWPLLSGPRVELDSKQTEAVFRDAVSFSAQLRAARITLYSLNPIGAGESVGRSLYYEEYLKGPVKASKAELGDLALEVLAVQSGGQAFAGSNDIGGMIRSAFEDGSAYYELTFSPTPAEHPDEYHQLEMQVTQPGLTLRARQSYYNQP